MRFCYRDYAAFRKDYVSALSDFQCLNSFQQALRLADIAKAQKLHEPPWNPLYGKECSGRDAIERPTEDAVCEMLRHEYRAMCRQTIAEQLQVGAEIETADLVEAFDADVLVEIVRELVHEARIEADLARRLKVRGETLEWVETLAGKTQSVTIPLPA